MFLDRCKLNHRVVVAVEFEAVGFEVPGLEGAAEELDLLAVVGPDSVAAEQR